MRHLTKRSWLAVLLGLAAAFNALAVVAVVGWRSAIHRGGQKPIEPFRIAGDLYYVGTTDVSALLLTGPQGHILIVRRSPRNEGRRRTCVRRRQSPPEFRARASVPSTKSC